MPTILTVFVLLGASLAMGFPIQDSRDVLSGPEFLAVFMRSRVPPKSETSSYYLHSNIIHKDHRSREEDYKLDEIDLRGSYGERKDVQQETSTQDPTTLSSDFTQTTTEDLSTVLTTESDFGVREEKGTTQAYWEDYETDVPSQVVSVRVSSSVVRQRPPVLKKPLLTVSTQDEPAITAIQRSHFSVEDPFASSTKLETERAPVVTYSQEQTVLRVEGRQSKHRKIPDSFAEASHSYGSSVSVKPSEHDNSKPQPGYAQAQALTYHPVNIEADPQNTPVRYHTSVSSATSGSRVQFYSEPPSYNRVSQSTSASYDDPRSKFQQQPERHEESSEKHQEEPERNYAQSEKVYSEPEKVYGEPEKVYGEPEKVYGEPEKVYGQPEKVYGQPEKIYGQPEKVYGQSEKVYSEPEKVYSEPEKIYNQPRKSYGQPEQNYEVDESVSVMTNGRAHGVQPQEPQSSSASTEDPEKGSNHKFGYVVEGRNFRKYRVEERTPDGFIVGEYGVVSHDDGSLRGVRYTADSTINPRLIYDALVKFLSLK